MDYRELLKKYINHVGECEGKDFTDNNYFSVFTEEEFMELKEIAEEAYKEYYNL